MSVTMLRRNCKKDAENLICMNYKTWVGGQILECHCFNALNYILN